MPGRDDGGHSAAIHRDGPDFQKRAQEFVAIAVALGVVANGMQQGAKILRLLHQQAARQAILCEPCDRGSVVLLKRLEEAEEVRKRCFRKPDLVPGPWPSPPAKGGRCPAPFW